MYKTVFFRSSGSISYHNSMSAAAEATVGVFVVVVCAVVVVVVCECVWHLGAKQI